MGFLDFFTGDSGNDLAFSSKRAMEQYQQQTGRNRNQALGALDRYGRFTNSSLVPFANNAFASQMGMLQGMGSPLLRQIQSIINPVLSGNDIRAYLDNAKREQHKLGGDAKTAAKQTYDDTVRLGNAQISDSLSRRGIRSTTQRDSKEGVWGANALGGLLNANASIDNNLAQRIGAIDQAGVSAMSQLGSQRLAAGNLLGGITSDILGKGLQTGGFYNPLILDLMNRPEALRAGAYAQPSALLPAPYTLADIHRGQQLTQPNPGLLGGMLSGAAGAFSGGLGYNLAGSLFG
jgi:hypothetical protein